MVATDPEDLDLPHRATHNVQAAPTAYDGTPGSDYAWGILVLNCNAGNVLGHLGYRVQSTAPTDNYSVTGYPGDKWTAADGYTMWTASGWVSDYNSYRSYYEIDANPGQSGPALWRLEAGTACGNCVIGTNTTQSSLFNSGTRITSNVWNALTSYKTTYP